MKLRTVVKIAMTSSIVLLCTGFIVFYFFKLSSAEKKEEFDLYKLVPSSATAVFETDNMVGLIQNIDDMNCSKEGHFLYVSKLFSYVKLHLYALLEETPHGLSRQMNKVLLSFHSPDNDRNQVLYCSFGAGDYELVDAFIKKYCISTFPSKMFDYKGEEIRIYPLEDNDFLACYFTSDFLAVSYQKKLIEQVIDAYRAGKSLSVEDEFNKIRSKKNKNVDAMIYTRLDELHMGKVTDGMRPQIALGGWMEFDMTMSGNAIYFSGTGNGADSCLTFTNMLKKQQAIDGFPGVYLPQSTYLFSRRSISDVQAMFDFSAEAEYVKATYSDCIRGSDDILLTYFRENCQQDAISCLFHRTDSTIFPGAVVSIAVKDASLAERILKGLIDNDLYKKNIAKISPITFGYIGGRAYSFYLLPRNTLFVQLTGITQPSLHTYACFYAGRLLLAPDIASLSDYIGFLENGEVIDDGLKYKESISGLADMYNFMLVADLSDVFSSPESYARHIPGFFFRNPDFFRHFMFSSQFSCTDGIIYSNLVLTYDGE